MRDKRPVKRPRMDETARPAVGQPAGRMRERLSRMSPARLLVLSFACAILAGTFLLWLPFAHHGNVGPLEALFTATSAVCVTGLIVVDTGSEFTVFGQFVILLLIQTGGLGIMTFAAIAMKMGGARMPLTHQQALQDSIFQRNAAAEFTHTFPRILKMVAVIELAGFALLCVGLVAAERSWSAVYSALFHTVSAFCNAGFSLYSDSFCRFGGNGMVVGTVMVLIVLGGLGHVVLRELYLDVKRMLQREALTYARRFSFHTRVVLTVSIVLILGGAVTLAVFGLGTEPGSGRLGHALFQSITARTAGFNTVDIGHLTMPSAMVVILLMFIGGAPGSCAGGIKTTSFAIWLARVRSALHGREEVSLLGRMIPPELVLRAVAVVGLAFIWNAAGVLFLSEFLPAGTRLRDIVFEQMSAFGTVGLSTGLTSQLTSACRLWIIVTMFVGRLGPLTLVLSFLTTKRPQMRYAEGRVMIG
ncbi:MAG: potassium transporter TrkG [Kiritimatiellia bacterium]